MERLPGRRQTPARRRGSSALIFHQPRILIMQPVMHIMELRGDEVTKWLDALGELRIRVFREYPYLYEGCLDYERDYLAVYQNSRDSLVVLVTDESGRPVGASTCLPLAAEGPGFREPFLKAGMNVDQVFYFGESVLLPEWRGRGIGRLFFDRREAHARSLGYRVTAFCAVDRPDNHPMRPPDFRPLDDFWKNRGYRKQPDLQARISWQEIGEEQESPKTLTFWTRTWTP